MMAKVKIGILGILYDAKSSYMKGPAKAPPLIREALFNPSTNNYTELGVQVSRDIIHDYGDFHPIKYFDISDKVSAINHAPMITLGGDHSITYPILKSYSSNAQEYEILQIDAHGDLYDEFQGDPFSHACPFARIMENQLASKLTQIGIRTLTPAQRDQAKKYNVVIHEMRDLDISKVRLTKPVYISLDMDGFDPAFAPGVSHHEPGGLTVRQVLDLIHSIDVPIIGADIVEYNPDRDIHGITAMLAGKMLKEIAGKMVLRQ